MPDSPYRGYKSYSYLTPADDYPVFDLADGAGRLPGYEPGLSGPAADRAGLPGWSVQVAYRLR
jgi:hypothetical protein